MGIQASRFNPFTHFSNVNSDDIDQIIHSFNSSLNTSELVEPMPPDVYLKRDTSIIPSILFTGKQFLTFQKYLPPRFQGRRWRLVYGSEHHGFARLAMQHNCINELKNSGVHERPAILIISAGSKGEVLIGAYLSSMPQASNRRYIGSEETFVFRLNSLVSNSYNSNSEESETSIHVFPVPNNVTNRYFMRCEDGSIAVGGGGKGPALLLHSDFSTILCSTSCPTFNISNSLLLVEDGVNNISGLQLEGGEPIAPVREIQLWTIGDEYFQTSL